MFPKRPVIEVCLTDETARPIYRKHKLVGYEWNWGDKISIDIKNQIHICIPVDSIYTYEDVDPTSETEGFIGQKYYNLSALKSFTLSSIIPDAFVWVQDEHFTYINNEGIGLDIPVSLKDGEQIIVQFFNFRKELMFEKAYTESEAVFELSPEESKKIVPGIYYMNIYLDTYEGTEEEQITTDIRLTNAYEIVVKGF
jgi:hypothetical protein